MAWPRTLYDKIWGDHLVDEQPDGTAGSTSTAILCTR